MPSRTRSEVRSQYNVKFDRGASTWDMPPPPWEAQRRHGIELPWPLPAFVVVFVVDLCCRALDCRHASSVANGPSSRLCSPLFFAWVSILSFRLCLDTSANFHDNTKKKTRTMKNHFLWLFMMVPRSYMGMQCAPV